MGNLEYLLGLEKGYLSEAEQLRQRLAKLEQALGGLRVAIELETERKPEQAAEDRAAPRTVRPEVESFKETIISEALRRPGQFTSPELYEDLRLRYPDREVNFSTVSHALRAAAERGLVTIVEKGAGKRASRYAVPQHSLDLNKEEKENGAVTEEITTP